MTQFSKATLDLVDRLDAAGCQNMWPTFYFYDGTHNVAAEVVDGEVVLTDYGKKLLAKKRKKADAPDEPEVPEVPVGAE